MMRNLPALRIPAFALLALSGLAAFPLAALSADDEQAERESRRIENEFRREQELARRNIEGRERAQTEALKEQQDSIRRMEATQARIQASSEQLAQQAAEQMRSFSYPYYPSRAPIVPAMPETPGLSVSPIPPVASEAPRGLVLPPNEPVSGIQFAPLSDRLRSYFGAQSGVLVVSAGAGAPFGLQDGDVLIAIDGRIPADVEHATGILRSYRPGERVRLRVQRDRRTIELEATAPGQRSK
jgi:hypothetical protein